MKMYKLASIATSLFLLGALVSCGDDSQKVITPASTEVSGDLGDCFSVVDRSYKLKINGNSRATITVELERTTEEFPMTVEGKSIEDFHDGSSTDLKVGFGIELLDKDGDIIAKTSPVEDFPSLYGGPLNSGECVSMIKLKGGRTASIEFEIHGDDLKKTASFKITSAYEEPTEFDSSTTSYSISSSGDADCGSDDSFSSNDESPASVEGDEFASSTSSSSSNWDALLDSYDRYVTKYIALAKKVKEGDMSAMSEYASMMQEAQNLSTKLSDAQNDMTSSQLARYVQITNKLSNAVQDM